jgi:hypothetical protein
MNGLASSPDLLVTLKADSSSRFSSLHVFQTKECLSFSRNVTDLRKYAAKHSLDLDLSKFLWKAGEDLPDSKPCPLVIVSETTDGVPDGWKRVTYKRQEDRKSSAKLLFYYVTPCGRKIW